MLNFYLIEDDQSKPRDASLTGLTSAGGLDETTFENLQQKGIIDERFDYYSTFRWGTHLIAQIWLTIQKKKMEGDADVQELIVLLDRASQNETGLIAYGD